MSIKEEDGFFVEEKPKINEISIKQENGSESNCSVHNHEASSSTPCIKHEKEDAICISSDEEDSKTKLISETRATEINGLSDSNSHSILRLPSSCTIIPNIKKKKEDAICISSDDEEESTKTKLKSPTESIVINGLAPSKTVTTPAVPQPQSRTKNLIPQPIPLTPVPLPIPLPPKPPVPQPIQVPLPITPKKRPVPKPIVEPAWPQPIVERAVPQSGSTPGTPGRTQAQQPWGSPRSPAISPRTRTLSTPRLRSPLVSPSARNPSPRTSPRTPVSPVRPIRNPAAVRKLFPQPAAPLLTVEGVLEIGMKPDGSYGYHVRLPDNGIINMNRQEIEEIRKKNNGVLPVKLEVPLSKKKKF